MTIADMGIVFVMVGSVSGSLGSGAIYYMHQEFITGASLVESELRQLKRQRRKLMRIPDILRTPEESWDIDDLADEIEDLKQELGN